MRAADPSSGWAAGDSYQPPGLGVIVPNLTFAIVYPPAYGVIGYEVLDLTSIIAAIGAAAVIGQSTDELEVGLSFGTSLAGGLL